MTAILIGSLWQGAFVVAIAALATAMLPQRNAATRYAVWFAALLTLALAAVATQWHPPPALTALPAPIVHTAATPSRVTAQAANAGGWWLVAAWCAGVAIFLVRLARSYVCIERIVRGAQPAPQYGTGVVVSDDVRVPIVARIVSPVIVLPRGLTSTLTPSQIEAVVQHERAHVRRGDVAGNLVAHIIEACLFFNPWVYIIGSQLVKEREASCDDLAVLTMKDPGPYASCLARIARHASANGSILLSPSAIGSRHMLVGRIARLLNGKAIQVKINYLAFGATVAAFALLVVILQATASMAYAGVPAQQSAVVASSSACTFPHGYSDVKPLNPVAPDIPKSDYRSGLSAGVLVTVDADARVQSAKIVKSSGSAAVDQATVEAATRSTYSPATKACKPVSGMYLFHIETGP